MKKNYVQPVEEVLQTLGVGLGGLTSTEAKERLKSMVPTN